MNDHLVLEGKCPAESTDEEVKAFIDRCIVAKAGDRFGDDYVIGEVSWTRPLDNFWQAIAVVLYHGDEDNG